MTNFFSRSTKKLVAFTFLSCAFSNLAYSANYLLAKNDCTKQNHTYATASDAMEYFSDFYPENNSLEIINKSPLKIRLSPQAVSDDHTDVKELLAKRAIIYGIYRTLD
ncbi:Uncharacterised protein [Providencia rustigianii]|nr:Uncharacterised protein [Providencia rustigianii]